MNEYVNELYRDMKPEPTGNIFTSIWDEYEKVVLHSLVTTFGLDFITDQDDGDVDTVRSVRESHVFKNQKYADKYAHRGDYDAARYHNDASYSSITADQRKKYNETGIPIEDTYVKDNKLHFNKGDGPWHRASLDHVVSAHEIHDDPVRMLVDIDGVTLANDLENLRYTNLSLNSKMKDMSIDEFIEKCEEHPEKVNWMNKKGEPLPEDVKERLRKADKESRRHQDSIISQLYYTSPQFYSDIARSVTKRGGEMGIRQAFGFVFIEIWYSCKKELITIDPGGGLSECINAILEGIKKGVNNVREKYDKLISQFKDGFLAGALASLNTALCSVFTRMKKNVVCYIRQAYATVVQAGNILFINPNDLLMGDQLKTVTVVLGSGASVITGMYVSDVLASTPIGMMPEVGPLITKFVSILVGGLLSCSLLILLDRSKLINSIVGRVNQYTTTRRMAAQTSRRFNEIAAELEGFEINIFVEECNRLSVVSNIICGAENPEEMDRLLDIVYSVYGLNNPWNGDFDEFMDDDDAIFDFS